MAAVPCGGGHRFIGVEAATDIFFRGTTLEEFLGSASTR
jgi:hypothetical protein